MGYDEATKAHGAEQAEFEGRLPGGVIERLEFAEGRAAGIVDQDIDLSECRGGGFDDVGGLRGIFYVDGNSYHASFAFGAKFFGRSLQGIGVTRADDDIRTFRRERSGAGFAESLTGSEDECRLSG
jgi:hypothetical protein